MTGGSDVWLESNADRTLARQRAKVDTAKLVVTFVAGVGTTLVATGLQVGDITTLDRVSASVLGGCIAAAILTTLLDRLSEADVSSVLVMSAVLSWNDAQLTRELRAQFMGVVKNNDKVVSMVMYAAATAILLAAVAGVLATLSLTGFGK